MMNERKTKQYYLACLWADYHREERIWLGCMSKIKEMLFLKIPEA